MKYNNSVNTVQPILKIPKEILLQISHQAINERPNECCGLLAGLISTGFAEVQSCYPLVNVLQSPTRFLSDPKGMFQAQKEMRRKNETLLAVYHSHPNSEPIPSLEDLRNSLSNSVACLIISLKQDIPVWRIWWLSEHHYFPAEYEVI